MNIDQLFVFLCGSVEQTPKNKTLRVTFQPKNVGDISLTELGSALSELKIFGEKILSN